MSKLLRVALTALTTSIAIAAVSGTPAMAAKLHCPYKPTTVEANSGGRLWLKGQTLYGCSTVYAIKHAFVRRLGPWGPDSKVRWDGVDAVWTVHHHNADGTVSDRVWGINVVTGDRYFAGSPIVPVGLDEPFAEARVQKLFMTGDSAGWVTTAGQVVLAMFHTDDEFGASAVGNLPAPPVSVKQLTLAGTFTSISPAQLASTAKIQLGEGETDDCGGSNPYTMTVQPTGSGPRVGVLQYGEFVSQDPYECNLF